MSLSEADIERVVQEVLRRLAAMTPPSNVQQLSTLTISTRLITTAELKGKLDGVKRIEVPARAVITPAARDYLRERGVQLVKQAS